MRVSQAGRGQTEGLSVPRDSRLLRIDHRAWLWSQESSQQKPGLYEGEAQLGMNSERTCHLSEAFDRPLALVALEARTLAANSLQVDWLLEGAAPSFLPSASHSRTQTKEISGQ